MHKECELWQTTQSTFEKDEFPYGQWVRAVGNGGGGGERRNQKFETRHSTSVAAPVVLKDDVRGISVAQSQSVEILGETVTDILKNVGHIPKGKAKIKGVNFQLMSKDLVESRDSQFESQTKWQADVMQVMDDVDEGRENFSEKVK